MLNDNGDVQCTLYTRISWFISASYDLCFLEFSRSRERPQCSQWYSLSRKQNLLFRIYLSSVIHDHLSVHNSVIHDQCIIASFMIIGQYIIASFMITDQRIIASFMIIDQCIIESFMIIDQCMIESFMIIDQCIIVSFMIIFGGNSFVA